MNESEKQFSFTRVALRANAYQYLLVFAMLLGLARNAGASQKGYDIEVKQNIQQINSSSVVTGYSPLGYPGIGFSARVDTGGANLSAAPILWLPGATSAYPSGYITFPAGTNFSPTRPTGSGYNNYWVGAEGPPGSGTFTFALGNATAQPALYLNTVTPSFPVTPMLTSGGTWSAGILLLDPTSSNTLTFNTSSFTTYTNGLGGQINYHLLDVNGTDIVPKPKSTYAPSIGSTEPALTSFTIAPGTMIAGQTYTVQADYKQLKNINTTTFTGTGIPANFLGASFDTTGTFITIHAQTPLLTSTYAGNRVIVSWPPAVTGWTLQTNNNLATSTWGNYLGPVSNNSVTSSPAIGNLFFRLTHP